MSTEIPELVEVPDADVRQHLRAIADDTQLDAATKNFAFCLVAWQSLPAAERIRRVQASAAAGRVGGWIGEVGAMMLGSTASSRAPGASGKLLSEFSPVTAVRQAIARDIPRYQPALPPRVQCPAAPEGGQPCAESVGSFWLQRDPGTGVGRYVGYCAKHITPEHHEQRLLSEQLWEDNGRPSPPFNTGGRLGHHFTANWAALYIWADPRQAPSPMSAVPSRPAGPPRRALQLVKSTAGAPRRD